MKILYIQKEYNQIELIKSWDYWISVGIADCLKSAGHQVDVFLADDLPYYLHLLPSDYDACILNDIAHSLNDPSENLEKILSEKIRRKARLLIGIIVESLLGYTDSQGNLLPFAEARLRQFERTFGLFDGYMAVDVRDAPLFQDYPWLWLSPWCTNLALREPEPIKRRTAAETPIVFVGKMNPPRARFLSSIQTVTNRIVIAQPLDEDKLFYEPAIHLRHTQHRNRPDSIEAYQTDFVNPYTSIRREADIYSTNCLREAELSIHLPTYFTGAHPRVVRSISAGVVCFTPAPPTLIERRYLSDEVDCLYYSSEYPESLVEAIRLYQLDESLSSSIIQIAQERSKQFRTDQTAAVLYTKFIQSLLQGEHTIAVPDVPEPNVAKIVAHRNYYLPQSYRSNQNPTYFSDSNNGRDKLWQPDVYKFAEWLSRIMKADGILDVGCGQGEKLLSIHHRTNIQIIGADFGDNIEACRATHPDSDARITWIKTNLDDNFSFVDLHLKDWILICSDVIEHLVHPEHLLTFFQKRIHEVGAIILSTPDRLRVRGRGDSGPPENGSHVREWALEELYRLVTTFNLPVRLKGLTINNSVDRQFSTSILVISERKLDFLPCDMNDNYLFLDQVAGNFDFQRCG